MNSLYIVGAARTPIGRFQGALAGVPAPRLGAVAIRGALERSGLDAAEVTDVILGNALSAGLGQAPARQAALYAGIGNRAHCSGVSKVCGSGLAAVIAGARRLKLQEAQTVVAGGMENMSAAPFILPGARKGFRLGHQHVVDSLIHDGLWDPHYDLHMGGCAEYCATRFSVSREEQDAYAVSSYQRAQAAQADGRVKAEINPVRVGETTVEVDEGPSKVDFAKIPKLKPAFSREGTVTAANASSINDGAAALVLATEHGLKAHQLNAIARIVSWSEASHDPRLFLSAPIPAIDAALTKAGWTSNEVDLWEINEAFAIVPLLCMKQLHLDPEKVNVRGGAIALGHPIGASGARILVTLLAEMSLRRARRGVAAICIGGGEALAMCVELLG